MKTPSILCSIRPLGSLVLSISMALLPCSGALGGQPAYFRRSDVNQDGTVDIGDAVAVLAFLFMAGTPVPGCKEAANTNSDGAIDLSDAIFTLTYLFAGGEAPGVPGPSNCGLPAGGVPFGCETYGACGAPPVITAGPSADVSSALPGAAVNLIVTSSDSDGDPLTFAWIQTVPAELQGTFGAGQDTAMTVWAPPEVAEPTVFTLQVSISDGNNPPVTATVAVSVDPPLFERDIQSIFTPNCSCHQGAFPSAGMNLSAGKAYSNIVNVTATACSPLKRILPGFPDDSVLVRKISGTTCGSRMPFSNPNFFVQNPGLITRIRSWVLAGALND